jgi:hypothetical protein
LPLVHPADFSVVEMVKDIHEPGDAALIAWKAEHVVGECGRLANEANDVSATAPLADGDALVSLRVLKPHGDVGDPVPPGPRDLAELHPLAQSRSSPLASSCCSEKACRPGAQAAAAVIHKLYTFLP